MSGASTPCEKLKTHLVNAVMLDFPVIDGELGLMMGPPDKTIEGVPHQRVQGMNDVTFTSLNAELVDRKLNCLDNFLSKRNSEKAISFNRVLRQ